MGNLSDLFRGSDNHWGTTRRKKGEHRAGLENIMTIDAYRRLRDPEYIAPKKSYGKKPRLVSVRLHPTKGYRVNKFRG